MSKPSKYSFKDFSINVEARRHDLRGYIVFAALFLGFHFILELQILSVLQPYYPVLFKISMSLSILAIILLSGRVIENIIINRKSSQGERYNLLSITRLITTILMLIVIVGFLFQNLYAIVVSFGLISLVLGFALQAPITSFIAWLYIVFRRPYKIGDRIQLDRLRGDVVEINYLDTAILECSGDYLHNDRRSGRIIYFPNSIILKSDVINYSGPYVPFIWNETAIQVAYTSDLQYVEKCLLEAASTDFENRYPMFDKAELFKWEPSVYFRVNQFAWLEAVVIYPVEPTDTTDRRKRILTLALPSLNAHPEKVQFPEGTHR
ncbi:MAG TPA: mechanosensitive ion channel domain-containing protein [Membranihabitans sp.]|nr:mechanosensitive ion channel domain-containing protein [Membranihabitans sp.]